MMRIAVCDDEPVFVEQISKKIKKYMTDCVIRGVLSSEELLLQEKTFELYFLDIQMEKMNGIEIAKKLKERDEKSIIVFITRAKEYVFDAFDLAALHYLVKPIDDEKLQESLKRAEKEIEKKQNGKGKQIFIKTRGKNITLNVADVLYFSDWALFLQKQAGRSSVFDAAFFRTAVCFERDWVWRPNISGRWDGETDVVCGSAA